MTCIVGIAKGKVVYLGGDSAGTSSDFSQIITADKKVFARGEFIFGVCGSYKVMNVLNHKFELPVQNDKNNHKFLVSEFIPAFNETLKKSGCLNRDGMYEGAILIGYRGVLYRLECNFQLTTNAYKFDAVGAGADIALGSLHSSEGKMFMNPKKRITKALEASAINNATVRPPFNIISVKSGDSAE